MRTSISFMFVSLLGALALTACGDDSGGGGSGGTGGAGGGSTSDTTTSTTTGDSTTSTSQGGGSTTSQGGGDTTSQGGGGVGGGATSDFFPIWENVAFPDDGGRVDIEAFSGVTLQVRAAGTEDVALELGDLALPEGAIVHAYAIGLAADDTLDAFLAVDNVDANPAAGSGAIRLAHFVPDAPAVDVFLEDTDGNVYGPIFDSSDFAFPAVSDYIEVPVGSYSAYIVSPGAEPADAIASFEGIEVADGEFDTVAAIGLLGDGSFDLAQYFDDHAAPDAGYGAITFVHTSPDAGAVDVGALLAP